MSDDFNATKLVHVARNNDWFIGERTQCRKSQRSSRVQVSIRRSGQNNQGQAFVGHWQLQALHCFGFCLINNEDALRIGSDVSATDGTQALFIPLLEHSMGHLQIARLTTGGWLERDPLGVCLGRVPKCFLAMALEAICAWSSSC